jgi:hypothetical protein
MQKFKLILFSFSVIISSLVPCQLNSSTAQLTILLIILAFLFNIPVFYSFSIAFGTAAVTWFLYANHLDSHSILTNKIGEIFLGLTDTVLKTITALIGGFSAGLGAWVGSGLRKLLN